MRETCDATKGRMPVKDTKGSIPITVEEEPWARPFCASLLSEALLKEIGCVLVVGEKLASTVKRDALCLQVASVQFHLEKGSKISDTKYMKTI